MTQFVPLLKRFAKDESGVFAVLFGLMAIVLIALGGATVDYVSLEQTRQRQTGQRTRATQSQHLTTRQAVTKPTTPTTQRNSQHGSPRLPFNSRYRLNGLLSST